MIASTLPSAESENLVSRDGQQRRSFFFSPSPTMDLAPLEREGKKANPPHSSILILKEVERKS